LADERIQQLKSLIATVGTGKYMWFYCIALNLLFFNHLGQLDADKYLNVLQEENTRLKTRIESLVQELVTLENQRGGRSFSY
jgi:hypothetical protein